MENMARGLGAISCQQLDKIENAAEDYGRSKNPETFVPVQNWRGSQRGL